jgi:CO/xanthine dehydrogenase Mo-binding subunit
MAVRVPGVTSEGHDRRETMALSVVGQPLVREEGPAKVTGAARYTADVPPLETVLVDAGSGPGPYNSKAIG